MSQTASKWKNISPEVKQGLMVERAINFQINLKVLSMSDYITRLWNNQFNDWKYELHMQYKTLETYNEALTHLPYSFEHMMNECH
ncbi:hypothetical protein C1H46_018989 [Malus baccata]|uniref:Uncharacterized protein n=1 Tax=Malus baccata TaxID=106549 RepID=A0A540M9G4_MALBA|nr:hypothetical protein C1H46_018989 [Malus baccata]